MASESRRQLESLEKQLIDGKISEKTYLELKAKLEKKISEEESSPGVPSPGKHNPDVPPPGVTDSSPPKRPAPFGDYSMDYVPPSSHGSGSPFSTPPGGSGTPFGLHSTEMPLVPGMELGMELPDKGFKRYLIGDLLGKGGWGAVFRAEDRQYTPARPVALKAIFTTATADEVARKRIEREARLGTELAHPNIVRIGDFTTDMGVYFLIMELVAGGDLNSLRAKQPNERFSLEAALPLLKDIAEGLDYLHSKGIIHRDLKPSNLLWHPDEKRLKISDFGLSKTARDSILLSGAKMPSISGTDPYMAPEIWDAEDPSEAGDLYALGIIAYEMLKGDPPFRGPNFPDQHRNAKVKPIPELPDIVNSALETILAKQASSRFSSGHDFVQALEKPPLPVCPVCGEKKDVERFACPKCGKKNICASHREKDGFCPDCHQKVVKAAEEERKQREAEEKRKAAEEQKKREEAERKRIAAIEERRRQEALRVEQEEAERLSKEKKKKKINPVIPVLLIAVVIVVIAVAIITQGDHTSEADRLQHRIDSLLVSANGHLQANHLTSPTGRNAYDAYREVLRLDGDNSSAQRGISEIADRYEQLGDRERGQSDWDDAIAYYQQALEIGGANSSISSKITSCRSSLQAAENRREAQRLEQLGDQSRNNRDWAAAIQHYERAIEVGGANSSISSKISSCRTSQREAEANAAAAAESERRRREQQASARAGTLSNGPLSNMRFVYIPAGSFMMGSPNNEANRDNNETQHRVTLDAFEMMTTEVTVTQFQSFVDATGYRTEAEIGEGAYVYENGRWTTKSDANWRNPYLSQSSTHPVVCVSHNDAIAFVNWLNERDPGKGYRLPTEAEWEYACRAGTSTPYSTGSSESDLSRAGWYSGNSNSTTHPVGQKAANAWGLYDMHGNVWEWCSDWYVENYYSSSPANNPPGPSSGISRVLRGGSWGYNAWSCRAADRNWTQPYHRDYSIGFRVVCSAQ